MTQHRHLLSPLTLRGHTLRNRIVFGAHTANMSDMGIPGPRVQGYLVERALGGAGMIVSEPVPVHRTGVLTRGNYAHSDDTVIPHFRKITDAVKAAGAVILQQLYHIGAHGDSDLSFAPHWSPSGMSFAKVWLSGRGGLGRLPFPAGSILDAVEQSAHRSMGWVFRKPNPLFAHPD
jgi:2,4-dienoyl-CoA reductase-like NADH-dependent reductase (Old Yellow Enzyme family)